MPAADLGVLASDFRAIDLMLVNSTVHIKCISSRPETNGLSSFELARDWTNVIDIPRGRLRAGPMLEEADRGVDAASSSSSELSSLSLVSSTSPAAKTFSDKKNNPARKNY